jgi:hypothetical protein
MAASKALITGCPRSGTGYISTVLARAGVRSGHECVYGPVQVGPWKNVQVEVSWLAAPSLPLPGVPSAHQVRHPLAVMRSLVGIGLFTRQTKFREFAEETCPALREELTPTAKAARMWCEWTRMTDSSAQVCWRVEDAAEYAEEIAVFVGVAPEVIAKAISETPTDVNHRRRAESLDLESIPEPLWAEVIRRAKLYGYPLTR